VGYSAVAVVVNKELNINNLSIKELKDIFTGKIKNWKELKGPDLPVKVVIPSKGYASRDEFDRAVMEKERFAEEAIITPEQTLSETVDGIKGAIGIVDTSMLDPKNVKVVRIEGVLPDKANIKSGRYKLVIPINLVTNGEAKGIIKEFIDFLLSPEGQSIVEKRFVGAK
jgi:phosphate transport system substrate-binding protein